mmetsp:Transcript_93325/g.263444  ORF Transcript_93325/g.263444 Transcript_93325/m.263444 type:complete len:210 (+) Transcript_93325:2131-2760(+)
MDQHGQQVSDCLAAACLGYADDVPASEGNWDGLRLDGRGLMVAMPPDALHELLAQRVRQIAERGTGTMHVAARSADPQIPPKVGHFFVSKPGDVWMHLVELHRHHIIRNQGVVHLRQRLYSLVPTVSLFVNIIVLLRVAARQRLPRRLFLINLKVRRNRIVILQSLPGRIGLFGFARHIRPGNFRVDLRHESVQRVDVASRGDDASATA